MMWTTRILADIPIKSCPHGIVDNIGFIHIEFSNVFPSTAFARFHASFPVVFLRFPKVFRGCFRWGVHLALPLSMFHVKHLFVVLHATRIRRAGRPVGISGPRPSCAWDPTADDSPTLSLRRPPRESVAVALRRPPRPSL